MLGLPLDSSTLMTAPSLERPTVLFCSAWPPAVGGAVSFAMRVANEPRLSQRFRLVPHQLLKRPSIFIPSDRQLASSVAGKGLRVLSGGFNLLGYAAKLASLRPAIAHLNFNARFEGPLLVEACTYLRLARLCGARTSMRLGAPFHFFELDPHSPAAAELSRRLLSRLDLLIVQSRGWQRSYEEWLRDRQLPTRCICIPNTVAIDTTAPSRAQRSTDRPFRIGLVAGPETEIKGAFVALEAFSRLKGNSALPPFEIHAISAGMDFRQQVAARGLGEIVLCSPALDAGDKQRWLESLDVFLLASLMEGFPNIILEAMAAGLAVVATRVGAVPDVIRDQQEGILVTPGDAGDLVSALAKLMTEPDLRTSLAHRARERVVEEFDSRGNWAEQLAAAWLAITRSSVGL